jgi:hypothetical protein
MDVSGCSSSVSMRTSSLVSLMRLHPHSHLLVLQPIDPPYLPGHSTLSSHHTLPYTMEPLYTFTYNLCRGLHIGGVWEVVHFISCLPTTIALSTYPPHRVLIGGH